MKTSDLLFSAIHLIVTLFVIMAGGVLVIVPYAPHFRVGLTNFLCESPNAVLACGIPILLSGFSLLFGFYFMHRKRYLKIEMGCARTVIEEDVIRQYVSRYWKELFPGKDFDLNVVIGKDQKIEIITKIPKHEEDEENLLTRIQNELGVLLARQLGYEKPFTLTITE